MLIIQIVIINFLLIINSSIINILDKKKKNRLSIGRIQEHGYNFW